MYRTKQPIRITESQLKQIVNESVKRILEESNYEIHIDVEEYLNSEGWVGIGSYDVNHEKAIEMVGRCHIGNSNTDKDPYDIAEYQISKGRDFVVYYGMYGTKRLKVHFL